MNIGDWPVVRQIRGADPLGRGRAVNSSASSHLRPRIADDRSPPDRPVSGAPGA